MRVRVPSSVVVLLIATLELPVFGAPITREQLLAMGNGHVEPRVMLDLVERDCVDFDVDAANVLELSKVIPPVVIEAAIRCRTAAPAVPPRGTSPAAPAGLAAESSTQTPATAAGPAETPSPAKAREQAASGPAMLRARAEFIGESGELTCRFQLDGAAFATLTKPAQGEFGQAVDRTKITRDGGFAPVAVGRHTVVAACDPGKKEMRVDVDLAAGSRTSVDVKETTFRGWKLAGVFSVP